MVVVPLVLLLLLLFVVVVVEKCFACRACHCFPLGYFLEKREGEFN